MNNRPEIAKQLLAGLEAASNYKNWAQVFMADVAQEKVPNRLVLTDANCGFAAMFAQV